MAAEEMAKEVRTKEGLGLFQKNYGKKLKYNEFQTAFFTMKRWLWTMGGFSPSSFRPREFYQALVREKNTAATLRGGTDFLTTEITKIQF